MSRLRSDNFYAFLNEITVPKTLILNNRITNDLCVFAEYTIKLDKELGGYLVRNSNGNLGVIGLQKGESREVDVQPNEELQGSEVYLGLQHFHPVTDTFSLWDVGTFLANPKEFISGVTGSNGDMNLLIKTPKTEQIPVEAIPALDTQYEQTDIPALADKFNFLYYKGPLDSQKLELMNKTPRANGVQTADQFTANIKGLPEIPNMGNDDVTKKCSG